MWNVQYTFENCTFKSIAVREDPGFVLISMWWFRSSHQRCAIEIGVLKNFTKFSGKHLCQSLFFNKVAGLRPATLLKKRLLSCKFCEIFKNTFLTEHLRMNASNHYWSLCEYFQKRLGILIKTYLFRTIYSKNCWLRTSTETETCY